ncbi:MAG: endonuclease domain-containing protein [Micrococcales bacterium]|nr:endonuclease domain-containing protein [Micrococcales bacterium]
MPRAIDPPDLPLAFTRLKVNEWCLTRTDLQRLGITRVSQGLYMARPPEHCRELAAAHRLVLTAPYAFSRVTAARLWGLPLPHPWSPGERLDVLRPTTSRGQRRSSVLWHPGLELRSTEDVDGLPVTTPAWTLLDLAALPMMRVTDLVAVGDALLSRDASLGDVIARLVERWSGRGVVRLREAVGLMRTGSGSPMESRARVEFHRGGLPEPELNVDVIHDGEWLGRVDFFWRQAGVVVEFEGDHHRTDRSQWQRDIRRERRFTELGYTYIRITSADLHDPRLLRDLLTRLRALVG